MPDTVNFIPEAQRAQFIKNMDILRVAWPQTHNVENTFLETCGMIPGLNIQSDKEVRERVKDTLNVQHYIPEVGARLLGDMTDHTEVFLRFKKPGEARDLDALSLERTARNQRISFNLHFRDADFVGGLVEIRDRDYKYLGHFTSDRKGEIRSVSGLGSVYKDMQISWQQIISGLMDKNRNVHEVLDLNKLVESATVPQSKFKLSDLVRAANEIMHPDSAEELEQRTFANVEDFLTLARAMYAHDMTDPNRNAQAQHDSRVLFEEIETVADIIDRDPTWRESSFYKADVEKYIRMTLQRAIHEAQRGKPNQEAVRYHEKTLSMLLQSIENPSFRIPTPPREPLHH